METNKRRGISLIVLVITIIVMIILAAAIILSISNSGIIGRANEATFKTDMQSYKEMYTLYVTGKSAEIDGDFDETALNVAYGDELFTTIFGNVPEKYKEGLKVKDGKLIYDTEDEAEKEIIKEIGMYDESIIDFKAYINGPVKINCPQTGLSCKGASDSTFSSTCNLGAAKQTLFLTSGDECGANLSKPTVKDSNGKAAKWVKVSDGDYFTSKVTLKCDWANGGNIYIADIKAKSADSSKPIASATRFYVKTSNGEYIFETSNEQNSQAEYILPTGGAGYVIDPSRIGEGRPNDDTTRPFLPYTSDYFANYNTSTGEASLTQKAFNIARLNSGATTEIEVGVFIEAGSKNFGWNLNNGALSDVEFVFVGIPN